MALCACATEIARKADVDDLRAEVRALRQENMRLSERLERLEAEDAIQAKPAAAPSSDPSVPSLTVIKLKPRTDPAPAIDTSVPVVEPAPEIVEELARRSRRARVEESSPEHEPGGDPGLYDQGLSALRTGNIQGGIAKLQEFAQENPRDSKADNALYFSGLGQMGLEEYDEAAKTFQNLIAEHPAGDAVQDAMLRLAECRVRLNQVQDAKELYTRVVLNYPGTAAANQAEQRLASLK